MKFPLAVFFTLLILALAPAGAQSAQQLLSEAQTSYIRGDIENAKKQFEMVLRLDPRSQVAINYLRMIKIAEAKAPKGNDQEKQLSTLIMPKVEFREATLGSVLDYLRQAVTKISDGKMAVSFVPTLPQEQLNTQQVTLVLTNVPFTEVLRYLGTVANVQFEYEKYAIKVKPAGGTASAAQP